MGKLFDKYTETKKLVDKLYFYFEEYGIRQDDLNAKAKIQNAVISMNSLILELGDTEKEVLGKRMRKVKIIKMNKESSMIHVFSKLLSYIMQIKKLMNQLNVIHMNTRNQLLDRTVEQNTNMVRRFVNR